VFVHRVQESVQHGGQDRGDDWSYDRGEDGPDDERMPLPHPEGTGGRDGVMPRAVEELMAGEGKFPGVEDAVAELNEEEEERELQRVDDVVGDLRRDEVEPEDAGQDKTDDGGRTKQGIDADDDAEGERPGEAAGAAADTQEVDERGDDPSLKERRVFPRGDRIGR